MTDQPTFKIRNWEKYQNYTRNKTCPPPWIKVYVKILNDQKVAMLSDAEFGQLIKIWICASANDNILPYCNNTIQRIAGLQKPPNLDKLQANGLIELTTIGIQSVDDLSTIGIQSVSPDQNRIEQNRKDKNLSGKPDDELISKIIDYLNQVTGRKFKTDNKAYRKEISRAIRIDGATWDQAKAIIDLKQSEWGDNLDLCKNMKPPTLFCAKHFLAYLGEVEAGPANAGQPQQKAKGWHERFAEDFERGEGSTTPQPKGR